MKRINKHIKFLICFGFYLLFMSFLGCRENLLTLNPFNKVEIYAKRF